MVAYSFKGRFAAPILSGVKRQTIRAHRTRHARPGEELQLYTGMRTKACKLVGRAICTDVRNITINLARPVVEIEGAERPAPARYLAGRFLFDAAQLDEFARHDGFADWADMAAFWRREHPGQDVFQGVLIRWWSLL